MKVKIFFVVFLFLFSLPGGKVLAGREIIPPMLGQDLSRVVENCQNELVRTTSELNSLRNERDNLRTDLEKANQEIDSLRNQLTQRKREIAELENILENRARERSPTETREIQGLNMIPIIVWAVLLVIALLLLALYLIKTRRRK